MGNATNPSTLRGVLLRDPRMTDVSASLSSYNEGGLVMDTPVPQRNTDMVLQARAASSLQTPVDIMVRSVYGGFPEQFGGGFVWRNNSEAATAYRGWDVPSSITGFDVLLVGSSTSYYNPHATSLPDGRCVCAYESYGSSTRKIRVAVRSAAGVVSHYDVNNVGNVAEDLHPCLLRLPSGRLLLYHFNKLGFSTLYYTVTLLVAEEGDPSVWTKVADNVLDAIYPASSYEPRRIRAGYLNGQILLMLGLAYGSPLRDYINAYATDTLGALFTSVAVEVQGAKFDVVTAGGKLVIAYLPTATTSSCYPKIIRAGSAYDNLASATLYTVTDSYNWASFSPSTYYITSGDLTLVRDEDGLIYLYGRHPANLGEGVVSRSRDNGTTFAWIGESDLSTNAGKWVDTRDASTGYKSLAACPVGGQLLMWHTLRASPGTYDESLCLTSLGGYTTQTMPSTTASYRLDTYQVTFDDTYFGFEKPQDCGWTLMSTGGSDSLLTTGHLQVVTSSVYRYYLRSDFASGTRTVQRFIVNPVSGGSLTLPNIALHCRVSDGASTAYGIRLNFATTGYRLVDEYNSANLVDVSVSITSDLEVYFAIFNDEAIVYHRTYTLSGDRQWTLGATLTGLTVYASASAYVRFGAITSATSTSRWKYLLCKFGSSSGGLPVAHANPGDLFWRTFAPVWQTIGTNVQIQAIDGPTYGGDEWRVRSRSLYPVQNIFPWVRSSPRDVWRSRDLTQQTLTFPVSLPTSPGRTLNPVFGLYLANINFQTATVNALTYSGTSQTLGTINAAVDLALPYSRSGNTLIPSASAASPRYIRENELAGCVISVAAGVLRRVKSNTAGVWLYPTSTTLTPVIVLEDITDTEPVSGTANVWAKNLLVLANPNLNYVHALQLVIPVATLLDSYFQIGTCLPGWMRFFGTPYSWGWTMEHEANVELTEAPNWKRRSRVLSPVRRSFQLAWADGVDTSSVQQSSPNPDYIAYSSYGAPVGLLRDTPIQLTALMRTLQGSHAPFVFVPLAEQQSSIGTFRQFTDPDRSLYCRLEGAVSVENVLGTEAISEYSRVATVTLVEEV